MTEQDKNGEAGREQIASGPRAAWERPEMRKMDAGEAELGLHQGGDGSTTS